METREFLRNATYNEFKDWLKDVCIDNSFNNIEDKKSFKTIVINDMDLKDEKSYYIIQDRDNINSLHDTIRDYINMPLEEQDLFDVCDTTRLFVYSYKEQLLNCNHKDILPIKDALYDCDKEENDHDIYDINLNANDILVMNNDIPRLIKAIDLLFSDLLIKPKFKMNQIPDSELTKISFEDQVIRNCLNSFNIVINNDAFIRGIISDDEELLNTLLDDCTTLNGDNDIRVKYNILPVTLDIFNAFYTKSRNEFDPFFIIEPMYELFKDQKYSLGDLYNKLHELLQDKNNESFNTLYNNLVVTRFLFVTDEELELLLKLIGQPMVKVLSELYPDEEKTSE